MAKIKCAIRKRRALLAVLAVLMTATAVTAAVQVFMYSTYAATIVSPKIRWQGGSDIGKALGSDSSLAGVSAVAEDNGVIGLSLKAYSNRRMLFTDVARLVNSDFADRDVEVGFIPGTFKIKDDVGYDNTENYIAQVKRLYVWVLEDGTATGSISLATNNYDTVGNTDDHDVIPTAGSVDKIPIVLNDTAATTEGWVTTTVEGSGYDSVGVYFRVLQIPEDYTLEWEIQARETAA